MTRSFTLNYW